MPDNDFSPGQEAAAQQVRLQKAAPAMLEVLKRIGVGMARAELEDRRLSHDEIWSMFSAIVNVVYKATGDRIGSD